MSLCGKIRRMTTSTAVQSAPVLLRERVAGDVRAALGRQRVSGSELARRLGVAQTWVSRRLRGDVAFDLDDLEAIAAALQVSVAVFVGEPKGGPTVSKVVNGQPMSAKSRHLTAIASSPGVVTSAPHNPLLHLIPSQFQAPAGIISFA